MQDELRECYKLGHLTDDFAVLAMSAANAAIHSKKNINIPHSVREEAFSLFCSKLVNKWEKIDPDKSPKSYIGLMAYTSLMDILRQFNKDLKGIDRVEKDNEIKKGINNTYYTPKKINLRAMNKKDRATIKKIIIKLLKKNVSKCEIERETGIPRITLIYWHNKYKAIGNRFYQLDKREKKRR